LAFCEDVVVKLPMLQVQYESSKNARTVLAAGFNHGVLPILEKDLRFVKYDGRAEPRSPVSKKTGFVAGGQVRGKVQFDCSRCNSSLTRS
jgi:hypothetical protein